MDGLVSIPREIGNPPFPVKWVFQVQDKDLTAHDVEMLVGPQTSVLPTNRGVLVKGKKNREENYLLAEEIRDPSCGDALLVRRQKQLSYSIGIAFIWLIGGLIAGAFLAVLLH